jgi:hypothetical protein
MNELAHTTPIDCVQATGRGPHGQVRYPSHIKQFLRKECGGVLALMYYA